MIAGIATLDKGKYAHRVFEANPCVFRLQKQHLYMISHQYNFHAVILILSRQFAQMGTRREARARSWTLHPIGQTPIGSSA
jgi:hypothetical protein